MARTPKQPRATFGVVGTGDLEVKLSAHGDAVTITMPNGFVLTLAINDGMALAERLSQVCAPA